MRHILFAVTPGVDVVALRNRAEACLLDVRCHDGTRSGDGFARAARELSNCPSGEQGGDLGWLDAATTAPPSSPASCSATSRSACCRAWCTAASACTWSRCWRASGGVPQPFEAVRGAVAMALRQQTWVTALRQYLQLLAGAAVLEGVDLDAADTPLVQ